MNESQLLEILYDAVEQPIGVKYRTSDTARLRTELYKLRAKLRKQGLRDFDGLSFRLSPLAPSTELWIFNEAPDGKEPTSP